MLTSASATAKKTLAAYPGTSGRPTTVTFASLRSCGLGQDGVFHGDVLDRSGDDGAGLVGVRRPDVDRNVVTAGVFHAAQHEHLSARRHLGISSKVTVSSRRALGTMRGSAVKMPSTSV